MSTFQMSSNLSDVEVRRELVGLDHVPCPDCAVLRNTRDVSLAFPFVAAMVELSVRNMKQPQ